MDVVPAVLDFVDSSLGRRSRTGCGLPNKRSQPGTWEGVFAAAFHNTNPDIILLGQDVGGIDKSTDGGLTWRHVNSEGFARPELTLNVFVLDQLLAHPTDDDLFFASSSSGLCRSRDVGETWEMVIPAPGSPEMLISWIAFSPLDSNLGLVGTGGWHEPAAGVGIYRTTDAGTTFAKVAATGIAETATITSIAFDPDDGTVYASTSSGRFRKHFDKEGNPPETMLATQEERLENWYLLQELAGVVD